MTVMPWLTLLSSMPRPLTFQKMASTFGSLTLMKPLSLTFLIMLVLWETNANVGKKFESWINEGKSPAVPGVLRLYQTLLDLGIKPIFITDTKEEFRQVRMANLKKAGYHSWFKFICQGRNDTGYSVFFR
ncbi:hypothetical protein BC332_02173 [Capsicum chinense]|nr:hypothetical protein BC332_02173 [Capsicum chinense]